MRDSSLSDGEWKLMNLLWDAAPRTIGEMVTALKTDTGWSKATVNIMLGRLADKGAVQMDDSGRAKQFFPLLQREEAVRREARDCLDKIRVGGVGLLVSTMAENCQLSDEEIDALYRILKSANKKSIEKQEKFADGKKATKQGRRKCADQVRVFRCFSLQYPAKPDIP